MNSGFEELCGPCGAVATGNVAISGNARVDGFFSAVSTLNAAFVSINGNFEARINDLIAVWGVDVAANASLQAKITALKAEINAQIPGQTSRAGSPINYVPARCEANVNIAVEAQAQCEVKGGCEVMVDPGEVSVECEGTCEGSCDATCTGGFRCDLSAGGTCEGSCSGIMRNDRGGDVQRQLPGRLHRQLPGATMPTVLAPASARARVEGTCELAAEAACSGTCTGSCKVEAEAECTGSEPKCAGSCSGKCEGKLQGLGDAAERVGRLRRVRGLQGAGFGSGEREHHLHAASRSTSASRSPRTPNASAASRVQREDGRSQGRAASPSFRASPA